MHRAWRPIVWGVALVWLACAGGAIAQEQTAFVVNGKALSADEVDYLNKLARQYGAEAIPGRYWYDRSSGLYGLEGQPTAGQILANLPIGGDLPADASRGDSQVWVNGRRLPNAEVQYLSQCTQVLPGRYWLDAMGNGGVEGGPWAFNIVQLCKQSRASSYRSKYGSVLSDGTTSGAIFRSPGGELYGVTCGPDGGCIY